MRPRSVDHAFATGVRKSANWRALSHPLARLPYVAMSLNTDRRGEQERPAHLCSPPHEEQHSSDIEVVDEFGRVDRPFVRLRRFPARESLRTSAPAGRCARGRPGPACLLTIERRSSW